MKKEFTIEDQWLPFEVHPDTPQEGVLLKDYFPDMDADAFMGRLNGRGESMGLHFGPLALMSNSRISLEAGEFAREFGQYHAYHDAMFRAYFTECKDIGDRTAVLAIAEEAGLDSAELGRALDEGRYTDRVVASTQEANSRGINAAPTFIIEGYGTLTGAHPTQTFRDVLAWVVGGSKGMKPLV